MQTIPKQPATRWAALVVRCLPALGLVGVLALVWFQEAGVRAQTAARGLRHYGADQMVFRNKSGSVMLRGDPAEWDTADVTLTGLHPGSTVNHGALKPDGHVFRNPDSLAVSPDSQGAPYQLIYEISGTINADTVYAYGTQVTSRQYPFSTSDAETVTVKTALSGKRQRVRTIFARLDSLKWPTSGTDADSVVIKYQPLLGIADADSLENVRNFIGVVASDSIMDDSLGVVTIAGLAFVKMNGNNTLINVYDLLTVGTTGFVKASNVTKDTLYRSLFTGTQLDSFYLRNTVVARALQRVSTAQDSGWVQLINNLW